jgi:capsular polysaccharide biosynthesis protein
LIVLPVLVAGIIVAPQFLNRGAAVNGGFTVRFTYTASQAFNLPQRQGDYQDVWLASEYLVNAFTDWIQSSTFRAAMESELGTPIEGGLGIATDNERSIGVVQMSYADGEQLQRIANAAVTVLETRSQEYFPHLGDTPAEVIVLDLPVVVAAPPPLTNRFAPLLQVGVALLGGLLLAFLFEYLDPTLRRPEEVTTQGIAVLASIPRHRV